MAADTFDLSVCICTRNRPIELMRALESLFLWEKNIHQIIVSDDSTDDVTSNLIKNADLPVQYVTGPKQGLSANRNHALGFVTGTHVLFIDDDVVVDPDFLSNIGRHYECIRPDKRSRVIVTGLEKKREELVLPHEQNFLGFQKKAYVDSTILRTIVINSTVFPMTLFQTIKFDEQLVYGYDEVDIATRASYSGFQIELCTTAINHHYPSEINRDFYQLYVNASRLYVTFKRYLYSEGRPIKAVVYAFIASSHLLASSFIHQGVVGAYKGVKTVKLALRYIRKGKEYVWNM